MKRILFSIFFLPVCTLSFAQMKLPLTVQFDFNKSDLSTESISRLDDFANRIKGQEIISVFIGGHCDSKGSNAYNDALSLRRINTVKNYLEHQKKMKLNSLSAKAFGENNLLNKDSTDEESQQNRRVEIIAIIKTKAAIQEQPNLEVKKETRTL